MTVDPKIIEAIEEAVKEKWQSKALARRLVAWFEAIASGNEDIYDKESANRHLELLYEATKIEPTRSNIKNAEVIREPRAKCRGAVSVSTTMRILGWKAEGLRCPDHKLGYLDSKGDPLPITLIQMPNGTGKTTTLSLLRAALSGSPHNGIWDRTQVMEFQKRDSPSPTGTFELSLLLNRKRVTIIMEFDFKSGRVDYKTTWGFGQRQGFDPPIEFRKFMNEDFVKFYVFDGELADNILKQEHTDAQKAVESLFQTHLLKKMNRKISDYWDDQTKDITAKSRTGFSHRKNRLHKWRTRLAYLRKEERQYQGRLNSVVKDLNRQRTRYKSEIKKDEDLRKRVNTAEAKATALINQVRESAQGVLDGLRDPHAISPVFATRMYELKQGLDRVKLPESAAREFFEELVDEEHCVCGRPIDDEIKETIKERAQQYLGSDDVALLNHMKGAIADAVAHSQHTPSEMLSKGINSLAAAAGKEVQANNELDELKREAELSDPKVMSAREEIERLKEQQNVLEEKLALFRKKDDLVKLARIGHVNPGTTFSIETARLAVSIYEKKVAEAAGTLDLARKRDILNKIIKQADVKARNYITSEIKDDVNERIAELMPDNPIRVEKIDGCIMLRGQSSGSAGENLSIGYAFLATLFNRSEHRLPFVVDSPANPIDYGIRPKIGQLAPKLAHQFIAFVISSEREKFLPSLKQASKKEIQYVTLFRKGASHHEEKAENSAGCIRTIDGYQVVNEEFFNDFQLDTEEE